MFFDSINKGIFISYYQFGEEESINVEKSSRPGSASFAFLKSVPYPHSSTQKLKVNSVSLLIHRKLDGKKQNDI